MSGTRLVRYKLVCWGFGTERGFDCYTLPEALEQAKTLLDECRPDGSGWHPQYIVSITGDFTMPKKEIAERIGRNLRRVVQEYWVWEV